MRNSMRTSPPRTAARFVVSRLFHAGFAVSAFVAVAVAVGGGCTTVTPSSDCLQGYTECGALCCPSGTVCSGGTCTYPYSVADLYIYMCPSTANCALPKFFSVDNACSPAGAVTPGSCVNTGLQVAASQSYAFSNCQACGSNCSNPVSFETPSGFFSSQFASGITLSCGGVTCTAPPDCGGPPTGTTGSSGASSGSADSGGASSGSASSGSGGGSGSTSGGGTSGGVTTCGNCPGQLECSTITGTCVVQSCACYYVINGSDGDSSWYLANGQCFMCQQNGLNTGDCSAAATNAAQAIVNCQ